jgi:FdhD protein
MVMDEHPAIRVEGGSAVRFMDHVIREDCFQIYLNNRFLTEQIASADDLRELGAGFAICEGLADHVERVEVDGSGIWIEADVKGPIELEYRSSGGCGLKRVPKRVVSSEGRQLTQICDIGRHNTVDKVVGFAELAGIDRSRCIIGCTGRQPAGMVAKHANAGISIAISRAASTNRGILTAEQTGLTLVCFSRRGRFTVYTHPRRIEGILGRVTDGAAAPGE